MQRILLNTLDYHPEDPVEHVGLYHIEDPVEHVGFSHTGDPVEKVGLIIQRILLNM